MLFAHALVVGCAKPQVGVDARADVRIDKPVPIEVAQPKPLEIAGPIRFDQPVNVTIQGLVIEYEGTFIPEPLFGQINEGDSEEYVAALFGKPDFESKLGDGTVVWRWKYRPKGQQGSLFNLFGTSKSDEPRPDHVSAIAIFKDGKLSKKWRG